MNIYEIPELEKIPGEEARQYLDDLLRSALLLPDREWIARRQYFEQDRNALKAPDWKVGWEYGG
jgi:hypothetical protein